MGPTDAARPAAITTPGNASCKRLQRASSLPFSSPISIAPLCGLQLLAGGGASSLSLSRISLSGLLPGCCRWGCRQGVDLAAGNALDGQATALEERGAVGPSREHADSCQRAATCSAVSRLGTQWLFAPVIVRPVLLVEQRVDDAVLVVRRLGGGRGGRVSAATGAAGRAERRAAERRWTAESREVGGEAEAEAEAEPVAAAAEVVGRSGGRRAAAPPPPPLPPFRL